MGQSKIKPNKKGGGMKVRKVEREGEREEG